MKAKKETIHSRRSVVATTSVELNLMAGDKVKWEENGALTNVWNILHQLTAVDQKSTSSLAAAVAALHLFELAFSHGYVGSGRQVSLVG